MQINLVCSDQLKKLLVDVLQLRGFTISEAAALSIVEKGFAIPETGLTLLFNYEYLADLSDFLDNLAKKPDMPKNIILGRRQDSESFEIIAYEDILYFEGADNYVYAYTTGDKFRIKNKLYELEKILYDHGFIRISKSILMNILHIGEIIPWFNAKLLLKLKNTTEIEVSRSYVRSFREYLEI
jgi:DNA-binding LytR/AlgR family response regulator